VWDYPRPPRVEPTSRYLQVILGGQTVAESRGGLRVLETSGPPCYYFPREDVVAELAPTHRVTVCEWKGLARHFDVVAGAAVARRAAWSYARPKAGYEELAGRVAFYPKRVEACFVDGELILPQPGDYYGGWITPDVIGPFKGDPGSEGW